MSYIEQQEILNEQQENTTEISRPLTNSEKYWAALKEANARPTVFKTYTTTKGILTYYHSRAHMSGFVPNKKLEITS